MQLTTTATTSVNRLWQKLSLLTLLFLLVSLAHGQGLPDLRVDTISWDTDQLGDRVTLSARVTNQGPVATPSGEWIGVLFSVDGNDIGWAAANIGPLAPGGSIILAAREGLGVTPRWSATAGPHLISAAVDPLNRIVEADETNNNASASWPTVRQSPDLVVSQISWDFNQVDSPVTFSAQVTNQGEAATPETSIRVHFSVDGINISWAASNPVSLAPGASLVLVANDGPAGIHTWTATPGSHPISATVDLANQISESVETNNITEATWEPAPGQPDLVASDLSWDTNQIGSPVTFSVRVTNQGAAPTPAGVGLNVYFNVDGTNIGWSSNGSVPLAPGASIVLAASDGPNGSHTWLAQPGVHQVKAVADALNRMTESNEMNNQVTASWRSAPPLPDLVVSDILWNTNQLGRPVTFSARILNQGNAPVPNGATIGVLFVVDGRVIGWGSTSSAPLAPGASLILTARDGPNGAYTWVATANLHQLSATVDDVNRILESNETNNRMTQSLTVVSAADPASIGQWSQVYNLVPPVYNIDDDHRSAFIPIDMSLLPTGKVLCWGRDPEQIEHPTALCEPSLTFLWDPADPAAAVSVFDPALGSSAVTDCLFCAGHCFLPDGKLLVAGGHLEDNSGLNATNLFDPQTNTWTKSPNEMNYGRWYPTTTTLPDGSVFVGGGSDEQKNYVKTQQIWETNNANPYWRTLLGIDKSMGYYPWLYVAPNGKLFWAGSGPVSSYIDPSGSGAWPYQGWTTTTNLGTVRNYGSSAQYDDGKIFIVGGYTDGNIEVGDATNTAEVINLNDPSPRWRKVAGMAFGRAYSNATVLPDGTVLITGGTSKRNNDYRGAVYEAELWNPQTETFTTLAASSVPRLYHSTAVLLPDGRVASAGGGMWPFRPVVMTPPYKAEGAHPDLEVYSPPYLFKGPRPSITSASPIMRYGQAFYLGTPDAPAIRQVTLVRCSSTTHSFNQNQRFNRLAFTSTGSGLNITAPVSGNLCPPGDYMLFIINTAGVPSLAKMVNIK